MGVAVSVRRILVCLCLFGLLWGERLVDESFAVLRAATAVQLQGERGDAASSFRELSLGEGFLAVGLALAAAVTDEGLLEGVADEARAALLQGCAMMAAAALGLVLVGVLSLREAKAARVGLGRAPTNAFAARHGRGGVDGL